MKKNEIIKGNKLIAEWLGYEIDSMCDPEEDCIEDIRYFADDHIECIADGIDYWETTDEDWTSWLTPPQMKFHSSYEWLMPVVNKCIKISHEKMLNEWENSILDKILTCDIETLYKEIVNFIKWYNK